MDIFQCSERSCYEYICNEMRELFDRRVYSSERGACLQNEGKKARERKRGANSNQSVKLE